MSPRMFFALFGNENIRSTTHRSGDSMGHNSNNDDNVHVLMMMTMIDTCTSTHTRTHTTGRTFCCASFDTVFAVHRRVFGGNPSFKKWYERSYGPDELSQGVSMVHDRATLLGGQTGSHMKFIMHTKVVKTTELRASDYVDFAVFRVPRCIWSPPRRPRGGRAERKRFEVCDSRRQAVARRSGGSGTCLCGRRRTRLAR